MDISARRYATFQVNASTVPKSSMKMVVVRSAEKLEKSVAINVKSFAIPRNHVRMFPVLLKFEFTVNVDIDGRQ